MYIPLEKQLQKQLESEYASGHVMLINLLMIAYASIVIY